MQRVQGALIEWWNGLILTECNESISNAQRTLLNDSLTNSEKEKNKNCIHRNTMIRDAINNHPYEFVNADTGLMYWVTFVNINELPLKRVKINLVGSSFYTTPEICEESSILMFLPEDKEEFTRKTINLQSDFFMN